MPGDQVPGSEMGKSREKLTLDDVVDYYKKLDDLKRCLSLEGVTDFNQLARNLENAKKLEGELRKVISELTQRIKAMQPKEGEE